MPMLSEGGDPLFRTSADPTAPSGASSDTGLGRAGASQGCGFSHCTQGARHCKHAGASRPCLVLGSGSMQKLARWQKLLGVCLHSVGVTGHRFPYGRMTVWPRCSTFQGLV